MITPSLSTIVQPKRELGETGTTLLFKRIKDRDTEHSKIVFEPLLIVRESSARLVANNQ